MNRVVTAIEKNSGEEFEVDLDDLVGGGGTPGGSDTQVQFNDGGVFGGSSKFTFNKTTGAAGIAGPVTIDASAANVTGLTIKTNGSAGNYTLLNSAIYMRDAAGNETLRIVATEPNLAAYGAGNLYIGLAAGLNQPTDNVSAGFRNLGIGLQPLYSVTTGFDNYAIGYKALHLLTTGSDNTAIGYQALKDVTSGEINTAMGNSALRQATGNNNTAIGGNVAQSLVTGNDNSFFGFAAEGSNGISNSMALGANAAVTASNRAVIGDANVTDVYLGSETAAARLRASKANFSGLPTSNPAVAGELWNDAGTVKISAG